MNTGNFLTALQNTPAAVLAWAKSLPRRPAPLWCAAAAFAAGVLLGRFAL